ncbi:hypothetical protein SAMN04489730_3808 [Amycolatopsis australiensis]|uniref:Uncharacterized protein n=1 Tax=Amycolatopsis australiensis TaxID=546364 RepID=A0A1K1RSA3_9PSEU|nr:hypothetical protein SAMN04489730_3808 [Amycolatopsis australiensis]
MNTDKQPLPRRRPGAAFDDELAAEAEFGWFPGTTVTFADVATSRDGRVTTPLPRDYAPADGKQLARIAAALEALPPCRSGCPGHHPPSEACAYHGEQPPAIRTTP